MVFKALKVNLKDSAGTTYPQAKQKHVNYSIRDEEMAVNTHDSLCRVNNKERFNTHKEDDGLVRGGAVMFYSENT